MMIKTKEANVLKQVVDAKSQPELYKLVKNVHVVDGLGNNETVPYYLADRYDSDYKQGVDKANGPAYDGKYHDFGKGKWQLSGDNAPCDFKTAQDMIVTALVATKINVIANEMRRYYKLIPQNDGSDYVHYSDKVSYKQLYRIADRALIRISHILESAQPWDFINSFRRALQDSGIESKDSIVNDSDELHMFDKSEQNYIKNSGLHYFIAMEEVSPNHFIMPNDVVDLITDSGVTKPLFPKF